MPTLAAPSGRCEEPNEFPRHVTFEPPAEFPRPLAALYHPARAATSSESFPDAQPAPLEIWVGYMVASLSSSTLTAPRRMPLSTSKRPEADAAGPCAGSAKWSRQV